MYDIGWKDEKKCRFCDNEEGTKQHRLYHWAGAVRSVQKRLYDIGWSDEKKV